MATTTNFGWTTPDNTGYVKDGALAIRTLGSAIDTSMADLKGGSSGQYLRKQTGTDMDFEWVTLSASPISYIGSVSSTSGSTVTFSSLNGDYKELLLTFNGVTQSSNALIFFRLNSDSGSNYKIAQDQNYSGSSYSGSYIDSVYGAMGTLVAMDNSSGFLKITNAQSTDTKGLELVYRGKLSAHVTSNTVQEIPVNMGGAYNGSSSISSINITLNSGTFSAGTWKLWGMAK